MTRFALLPAVLFSTLSAAALAQPKFKTAPGVEKTEGEAEGGGWAEFVPALDTEGAPPWAQTGLDFLANNYGYIGVAAVLLMLFLFARGPGRGGETPAKGGAPEHDDFFEPGDADSYRGGPGR